MNIIISNENKNIYRITTRFFFFKIISTREFFSTKNIYDIRQKHIKRLQSKIYKHVDFLEEKQISLLI